MRVALYRILKLVLIPGISSPVSTVWQLPIYRDRYPSVPVPVRRGYRYEQYVLFMINDSIS